jgi:AcrR family transcriptional regulator
VRTQAEQFADYPRQGNFEEKQQLILEAAARLFVEKGVHETSLSEIARRFGISKPALYHYANSKDEMIALILNRAGEGNSRILREIRSLPGSGLDKLRAALFLHAEHLDSDFGRCLATIQVSTLSKPTLALHRDTHRILLNGMTEIVKQGIDDRSIRPCQARIVVLGILNALNSMARWFDHKGPLSAKEVAAEIIDAFTEGVSTTRT